MYSFFIAADNRAFETLEHLTWFIVNSKCILTLVKQYHNSCNIFKCQTTCIISSSVIKCDNKSRWWMWKIRFSKEEGGLGIILVMASISWLMALVVFELDRRVRSVAITFQLWWDHNQESWLLRHKEFPNDLPMKYNDTSSRVLLGAEGQHKHWK